jgi:hypothetical protein
MSSSGSHATPRWRELDSNFRFRARRLRFRIGLWAAFGDVRRQQPQIIDGGLQPKPAITALGRSCIHAEPEVRIHSPPARREMDSNSQSRGNAQRPRRYRLSFAPGFPPSGKIKQRRHEPVLKPWSCHAGPRVRIQLPPAVSQAKSPHRGTRSLQRRCEPLSR